MPQRIQLSRARGWRKPLGAVVVSRPSKWGNPWAIRRVSGQWDVELIDDFKRRHVYGSFSKKTAAAKRAVEIYQWHVDHGQYDSDRYDLSELTDHDLACWCPLVDEHGEPFPCHGSVLLHVANQEVR